MKNLLWNNWQAKLVSFLIALVIWAYVKNLVDPSFIDRLLTGTFTPGR
jgi:YbbR domain-containing protein